MRISRSARTSEDFALAIEKLADSMPGSDKLHDHRLEEHRDGHDHEHKIGTEEAILDQDRKNEEKPGHQLTEKNLREHGVDKEVEAVTEKQLNEAGDKYPHRNPEAHERTGDKRPVNALDEEMGEAGDASKLERYEEASKADMPDRILDKDIGKQLTNEKTKIKNAFNLKSKRKESLKEASGEYLSYRQGGSFKKRFSKAKRLDEEIISILRVSEEEGRELNDKERTRIDSMKAEKSRLLGLRD